MSDSYGFDLYRQSFFLIGVFLLVYMFLVTVRVTWSIPGERIITTVLVFHSAYLCTHTHCNYI